MQFTQIVIKYLDHADRVLRHSDGTPTGRAARIRTPLRRWTELPNPRLEVVQFRASMPATVGDMTPDQVGHGECQAYKPALHKMAHQDRDRCVDLAPVVQRLLLAWCEARLPGADDWLFPGRRAGLHITRNAYANAVRRVQIAAGIARWPPAQLRHTALSLVANRDGIEVARELADHARSTITEDHYVTAERKRLRRLLERYG